MITMGEEIERSLQQREHTIMCKRYSAEVTTQKEALTHKKYAGWNCEHRSKEKDKPQQ